MPIDGVQKHITLVDSLESVMNSILRARSSNGEVFLRQHLNSADKKLTELRDYILRTKCNFIIFENHAVPTTITTAPPDR